MLDVKRLIGEVAAKNGIRLESDDPAFALVTLNQLVLEETVCQLNEQIASTLHQFTDALNKAENRAGKVLAQDVKAAAAELRKELNEDITKASLKARELVAEVSRAHSRPVMYKWMALGIVTALLSFVGGMLAGRVLIIR